MGSARARVARMVTELRGMPEHTSVTAVLARLDVTPGASDIALVELVGGGLTAGEVVAQVGNAGGTSDFALKERTAAVVSIGSDVYRRVPTAEARVRLLELARRAATRAVVVHVPIVDDGTHAGRLAIDAPRALLRAAGIRAAEAGDRFGPPGYIHGFFDEEALLDELARAGLSITKRRGFTFVLKASSRESPPEHADSFVTELRRVAQRVREVDQGRKTQSPREILAAMRARGIDMAQRGPVGRARLRRAVGWIDAVLPGTASCYRRILLEVALDAGAARETVVFGLDVGSTGHVAFEDQEERAFDVSFAIPGVPGKTTATRP